MALASYADLLSAVQDYEDDDSSVVTDRIADMVTLAEQRIFYGGAPGSDFYTTPLRCRAMEREITLPIGPGSDGGTSAGTANAQTLDLSAAPSLTLGTSITFTAGYTNTGATTLNAESTGAVDVRKGASRDALEAGDILAGGIYTVYHDGTYWVLMPSDGAAALPADFLGVKSAYLQDSGVILTPQTNAGVNTFMDGATAETPEYYTIQGDCIRLEPLPQSAENVKLTFYRKPAALSASLNTIFRQAPAIYLYATLFELALYLPNAEGISKWFPLYRTALDGYMNADTRASMSYGAGPRQNQGQQSMTPFAPWLPDVVQFNPAVSSDARNVIPPAATGFKPWPSFSAIASALTARASGAFAVRGLTGSIYNFAGDATKLYKAASDGLSYGDVTRVVGGAYATPIDGWWSFSLFGDYVIACNQADATQVFQLSTATNFAALTGSPPQAAFTGTIRDFVILARTNTNYNRIQWSGINDSTAWTPSATTMADYQDFPDGGIVMGFVGGEYGVVFQERAIQRMAFEGPPTIFRFDKISNTLGCQFPGSIAAYENLAFFKAHDGLYMLRGGSELVPIGTEKVDRWLNARINMTYAYRCTAAIDPARKLYLFGYPSQSSVDGTPDEILAYHWPSGEFSYAQISHEILYTGAIQASYTIDGLSALSSTIDGLTYPVDSLFYSGSGQLMIAGFDTSHRQGFFTGSALEATIETGDIQFNQGRKTMLRGARPMVEGASVTPKLKVKYRDHTTVAHASGSDVTVNSNGFCNFRVNARYHRGVMTIPAASVWDRALGLDDIKQSPMGAR